MKRVLPTLGILGCFVSSQAFTQNLGPPSINVAIGENLQYSAGTLTSTSPDLSATDYYVGGTGYGSVTQSTYGADDIETALARTVSAFEITGPSNISVTVDLNASGSVSATGSSGGGSSGAQSLFEILSSQGVVLFSDSATVCSGGSYACSSQSWTSSGTTSFNLNQSFTVSSNSVYRVVAAAEGSSFNGTFNATIDPSVTIDPSFSAPGYSILYSADAPLPTPLPASFWLMLGGLGGLALGGRRRIVTVV